MSTGWVIFNICLGVVLIVGWWFQAQLREDARYKARTGLPRAHSAAQRRARLAAKIFFSIIGAAIALAILLFAGLTIVSDIYPHGFLIG